MTRAKRRPSGSDSEVLLRSDQAGIATLTLNRPQHYNTLSTAMLDALQTQFDALSRDRSIRVIVIAAAGKAFCAGHDLKEMRAQPDRAAHEALFRQCSDMMLGIVACPIPVIAKVQGVATAAGCQLVATCDLAVASREAAFGTSGINMGLFCSTPMVALSRNIGRKRAMEMLLTGDLVDADTAVNYGLINRAVAADDLDRTVTELAVKIGAKSGPAIRYGKQAFYRQVEMDLGAAYAHSASVMADNMCTLDVAEGLEAFIDKRKPTWKHE